MGIEVKELMEEVNANKAYEEATKPYIDALERLLVEYVELVRRTDKLEVMIEKYHAHKLDFVLTTPIEILERQHSVMKAYLEILKNRLTVYEGISLDVIYDFLRR